MVRHVWICNGSWLLIIEHFDQFNMIFIRYVTFVLIFFLLFMGKKADVPPGRHFFAEPSFEADSLFVHPEWIAFQDTVGNDTLYVFENKEGLIHSYFRKINTGVCIDGQCRRLSITLFWTVTGRYFGFVLPAGEFLSKAGHVPFNDEDYQRLQEILQDPSSPMGQYRIDELVSDNGIPVDGITAATVNVVQQAAVPDAVYTTYTLWNLVYGKTREEILKQTYDRLTDQLVVKLLESPDFEDKRWTLENMGPELQWSSQLRQVVLYEIIRDDDILAVQALSALPDSLIRDSTIRNGLIKSLAGMSDLKQRKILEKLDKSPELDLRAALLLAEALSDLSEEGVDCVFKLLEKHRIRNPDIDQMVIPLLDHENRFIGRKAANFLETKDIRDHRVRRKIRKINAEEN